MEKRPEAPRLQDRRFQMEVVFLDAQQAVDGGPLAVPAGAEVPPSGQPFKPQEGAAANGGNAQ